MFKFISMLACAVLLASASLSITTTPAAAQTPAGVVDLTGEWVGDNSQNRVRLRMHPDGFFATRVTTNPGQSVPPLFFARTGPSTYRSNTPGSLATVQILGPDVHRITTDDGWTDVFRRVSR